MGRSFWGGPFFVFSISIDTFNKLFNLVETLKMNNVKSIKLKANPTIWGLIASIVLLFFIAIPVFIFSQLDRWWFEYGQFDLISFFVSLIFIPMFYELFKNSWIFKRWKWGKLLNSEIEIPVKDIDKYGQTDDKIILILEEKKSIYTDSKNLISSQEEISEALSATKKIDMKESGFDSKDLRSYYFIGILILLHFAEDTKYNPKYYLPLLKPEVVNIEGTITNEFIFKGIMMRERLYLKEYPDIYFRYSREEDLVSDIITETVVPKDSKVSIKIRKIDLKKIKSGSYKEGDRIDLFGVEYDKKIVLQKWRIKQVEHI